uniref:Dickkopf N-terminal cysteine-rich domain-containing protein n=1 Tax=Pseudomonas ogarae (strain DSM 112162 / CECT 30235 / F113) TaxID=1114970 RepID=UPI0035900352
MPSRQGVTDMKTIRETAPLSTKYPIRSTFSALSSSDCASGNHCLSASKVATCLAGITTRMSCSKQARVSVCSFEHCHRGAYINDAT